MKKAISVKWALVFYDLIILIFCYLLLLKWSGGGISDSALIQQISIGAFAVFLGRAIGDIYGQVWRYGGVLCYIRLLITDSAAFFLMFGLERILVKEHLAFARLLAIASMNLLGALAIRLLYRYAYKCGTQNSKMGRLLLLALRIFGGKSLIDERGMEATKINIAIVGAGRVGVCLAEELLSNHKSPYMPCCFVDVDKDKVGKVVHGLHVYMEGEVAMNQMKQLEVQEVVFALPQLEKDKKKELYEKYAKAGYKIKIYDYPIMQNEGRRQMRTFDIEDLLFRKSVDVRDEKTYSYYKDKVIMITGGGGSIGSELCRQLAKMKPKQIIILDIYENGAYDVQQELRIKYKNQLDVQIEILSVTDQKALGKVFQMYHPEIVIHAAAHKHVPLMEHNCVEAVLNNVFGTKNVIEACEKYGCSRFMMVSTDKAVNPTNVMGATKRMCEILVQSASLHGKVKYSATRFGNVLGSAGSVIPLFRRQISNGGPVTITDKRIIRYFMTIPEASQLVLASGAMADNGELFVLDMGQPVRIMELAEKMIELSGVHDIEIIETGLRPGEKLYEELLVKTEELEKTENSMIFIEHETPLTREKVTEMLQILHDACETGDDDRVRETLHQILPTYKRPEEVNAQAELSQEMRNQKA